MKLLLKVMNTMALRKIGSLIANARPELNEALSDEHLTTSCLVAVIEYITEKKDVKDSLIDAFGFGLNAPDIVQEAMLPAFYEVVYGVLPETHHEEVYANFVAIQFVIMGMVDDPEPSEFNLKMAIGGATEGKQ